MLRIVTVNGVDWGNRRLKSRKSHDFATSQAISSHMPIPGHYSMLLRWIHVNSPIGG